MSLESNLADGEDAVLYTRTQIPQGAATKVEDMVRSGGKVSDLVDLGRGAIKASGGQGDFVEKVNLAAKATGAGNCGEQSYVAFKFLRDNKGLHNLAVIVLEGWNHQFMAIDVARLNGVNHTGVSLLAAPGWGDDAVICDPWFGMAFPVSQWTTFLPEILRQTLRGRAVPNLARALVVEFHP